MNELPPPLIELHEVPGICTGDDTIVLYYFVLVFHYHQNPMTIKYYQSWLLMNENHQHLIELHVVPGICTGDERYGVVLFCPSAP
jgi:hypothetical protein